MGWNKVSEKSHQHNQNKNEVYEWIRLFQKQNDEEAQLQLVNHYDNLVRSLARRFSKGRYYDEDIYQVGIIGLLAALRRYDEAYGRNFESFAVPTIVGEIKRFIRDKTWSVHVPRRIKELGPRIKRAVDELTNKYQRSPLIVEIAEHLNVCEEDVLETMEMSKSYHALSVDRSLNIDQEGGVITLLDLVGEQESGYEKVDRQHIINQALQILDEREKRIIQLTFFENYSQKETGDKLGISQMHVSRLQRKALEKLKSVLKTDLMEIL